MNIEEIFGVRVFDDAAMKKRLPKKAYESLSRTRRLGEALDPEIADVVACAMKDWAIEQGATHYYPLVPADEQFYRRQTRRLSFHNRKGRQHFAGLFQQGADSGRGGCLLLPVRRPAGNL